MKQNNPKETEKGCLICGYKPKLCLVLCVEEEFDKFDADENNHHACYECEGSLIPEKLRGFISQLLSDARREERERCLETICKRLDDLGDLCNRIPVWKSAIKDTILSEGTRKALTIAEERIKNLK